MPPKKPTMSPSQRVQKRRRAPALSPQDQENKLIAMAMALAEDQLEDGTISAQVHSQLLKLGSSRERIEQERMKMALELDEAKRDSIASAKKVEDLMTEALDAFRAYSGNASAPPTRDYDD